MKKCVVIMWLLAVVIAMPTASYGQSDNQFYSLAECNNNVNVFMEKNYGEKNDFFCNVPFAKIFDIQDPKVPFKAFVIKLLGGDVVSFILFTQTIDELKQNAKEGKTLFAVHCVLLEDYSKFNKGANKQKYDELTSLGGNTLQPITKKFKKIIGKYILNYPLNSAYHSINAIEKAWKVKLE